MFMRKPSRQFVFQRVYDMAAMVEECIENEGSLIELIGRTRTASRACEVLENINPSPVYICHDCGRASLRVSEKCRYV